MSEIDPFTYADEAAKALGETTGVRCHDVAVVLGSGWAAAASAFRDVVTQVSADSLPGFRPPALEGHSGQLWSVRLRAGQHGLIIGARTHLYEGHGVDSVVHGVRTAAAAGCHTIVLTNGCGATKPEWAPGTPVLISDHLNLTGTTPLRGAEFIDMSKAYDPNLQQVALSVDPTLPSGVYAQFRGPQFETPAEVTMARTMGADLVGMSTALETIAARHVGMRVLGMSLVTNPGAGVTDALLSHHDVVDAGRAAGDRLSTLLHNVVNSIADQPR